MNDYPHVKTKLGYGRLLKIIGDKAYVEFDYMYLVELDIKDIALTGVELGKVEIISRKEGDQGER